jgi:D-sedoheptulose 7-phosphate isomerase
MIMNVNQHTEFFSDYASRLQGVLSTADWSNVSLLASDMLRCWKEKRQVFICGNGGSAGNAIHLANDFLYGVAKKTGAGMRVQALSANPAVITCLGNDAGYDHIFSEQLAVLAQSGDLLIALSGSGNSPNIVRVIEQAKAMDVKSFALLGFSGGKCKDLANIPIHFPVNDMQIAEDLQIIVGHMLMQRLYQLRSEVI